MLEPKKIMILGAGRGQLGTIKAAKDRGLFTIVATMPSETAPGIPLADELAIVDISSPEGILQAAKEHSIDAIATSCADTGVPALGLVVDELGLSGVSANAAEMCADKLKMKNAFEEFGVRTARFRNVSNTQDVAQVIEDLGLPLIVKAIDLQGSQGIVIAHTAEETYVGFEHAISESKKDHVIIEQYIVGEEFGAQALVQNGDIAYILPHGDETFMAKTAVPVGHSVPLEKNPTVLSQVAEETTKAIRAIGLDNCAVNVDLIYRDGEVFIIEITGRAGANGLPEMVSKHFEINYYDTLVGLALGEDVSGSFELDQAKRPAVAVRMIARPDLDGVIETIEVEPSVVPDADYLLFRKKGERISGFTNSGDCVGQVAVSANTLEEAMDKLELASSAIQISLR